MTENFIIEFNGNHYPARHITLDGIGETTVSVEELNEVIMDKARGKYVNDFAKQLDESIVYYVPASKMKYSDKDLAEYLEGAASTLAQKAANYILNRADGNPAFRAESLKREEILRGIQIYKDFPELDVSVFAIVTSKLPDYNMYKKISNMQPDELNPSYKADKSNLSDLPAKTDWSVTAEHEEAEMPEVL